MIVYDGDCAFCSRTARWIGRRLPAGTLVVPWQAVSDLATLELTPRAVTTASYWIDPDGRLFRGERGVAKALVASGGLWAVLGRLMLLPPVSFAARFVYWLVVRNRHRLPGGTAACRTDGDTAPRA